MFENSHASASVATTSAMIHADGCVASSVSTTTRMTIITSPVIASSPARFASLSLACARMSLLSSSSSGQSEARNTTAPASKPIISARPHSNFPTIPAATPIAAMIAIETRKRTGARRRPMCHP